MAMRDTNKQKYFVLQDYYSKFDNLKDKTLKIKNNKKISRKNN